MLDPSVRKEKGEDGNNCYCVCVCSESSQWSMDPFSPVCQIDVNPQIKIVNVIVNIAESIQEPGLGSKDTIWWSSRKCTYVLRFWVLKWGKKSLLLLWFLCKIWRWYNFKILHGLFSRSNFIRCVKTTHLIKKLAINSDSLFK